MELLRVYAEASGQEINMTKSEVFFSRNISRLAQEDLARVMGFRQVLGASMYLGLPSMIGRSRKATFAFIKDRIWKKTNAWRGRSLSKEGNEVMIKSMLQAIPSYIMSVFIIPDSLVNDIEKRLNYFWWGDFKYFNMAMIAKQGWHMKTKSEMLVSKVFKAKYYLRSSFFEANLGNNLSFVWISLWKARKILTLGCKWNIGDGSRIKVMNEPWLRGAEEGCFRGPQG
ncbi:hypothetical protein KIW84_054526 [Lathyrus oleraceus]|uniref:Uncharacterized protein n=1 Tax=Pisum sativum TaxID=3888 RepID=A0A9D4WVK1_PEA|nr:hypothetical protein KIW84_054526 [Pisum sativum]